MAFWNEDPFAAPSRRHTFAGDPPLNRTSRSGTINGVNYHFETAASPAFSFGIMGSGSSRSRPQPTSSGGEQPPRRNRPSVLGTAFNLLGSVLASRQVPTESAQRNDRRQRRRSSVDGLAYGNDYSDGDPESLLSNSPRRSSPERRYERRGSTRGQSPRRRRPNVGESRRSRSYRDEEPKPSRSNHRSAYVEDYSDEESDQSSNYRDEPRRRSSRRAYTEDNDSMIEALEQAKDHHRHEADKCRQRTQQLLQSPMADLGRAQQLLHETQKHETAYEKAKEELKVIKGGRRGNTQHSQHNNRPRATFTFGTSQSRQFPQDDFDSFFFQNSRPQRSPFGHQFVFEDFDAFLQQPFRAHNDFFGGMGSGPFFGPGFAHLFNMPGATFTAGPQPQARSVPRSQAFHSQAGPSIFTPPKPTPPTNLLKPEEAKQLFKTYNDRWNSIGPTDPNIPYPARRLHSNALLTRDSIWAPHVSCSIAEWSEEFVMQANAQAFYLGVVGLTPHYTETLGSGKIAMGYNKLKATPAQVKELIDLLKKEKARWHSDRLGRRNAGMEGPNEALQRDDKARAVFHAVCELMEAAQGLS